MDPLPAQVVAKLSRGENREGTVSESLMESASRLSGNSTDSQFPGIDPRAMLENSFLIKKNIGFFRYLIYFSLRSVKLQFNGTTVNDGSAILIKRVFKLVAVQQMI